MLVEIPKRTVILFVLPVFTEFRSDPTQVLRPHAHVAATPRLRTPGLKSSALVAQISPISGGVQLKQDTLVVLCKVIW